jgi:hypothetical protein
MSDLKKRIEQNRKNGSKGGRQSAKLLDEDGLEKRARAGGTECLLKYGRDFYRSIRAMRTA